MSSQPVTVVLLASDLMLSSTVSGFAASNGVTFRGAASAADVVRCVEENPDSLLLLDLGTPGLDVQALADVVPENILKHAVAYGPHVHTAKLDAAAAAGVGRVMSRGQFSAQVGRIIANAVQAAGSND